ncbi:histidine ammonia-lyase [Paenibacillus cremeus]|uniref:Histidine ammonia-lyase n=1 Tax=Paenibacillus cremeus TaxID=2163881 RepID=A0A559JMB8_9BACL|nr:histidine ammonia-lyase [Paenibacillus cremeus]TVY01021.1 histidine ammonia-lyase [Paenibacillus cremeus]
MRRSRKQTVVVDGETLSLEAVSRVALQGATVEVSEAALQRVIACRQLVDDLVSAGEVVYGVTTGFGKFSDVRIPPEEAAQLQVNLLRSHACAVGEPLPVPEVRAVMLLRANTLAKGRSGIHPETLQRLVALLNLGIHPVVPQQGSLGASGDLAPLAHLALILIGEGEAWYRGRRMPADQALARAGLAPLVLRAKEGLALINGTQIMSAIGALTLVKAKRLMKAADMIAALSFQCLRGVTDAFADEVHAARPFPEQVGVAANLRRLVDGSRLTTRQGEMRVQDAYSLRCLPQVHGAARQVTGYAEEKLRIEMNAATDNPLLFVESGRVISGGNFHGQPLAFAMDFVKIALSALASMSERRTERLVNPALSGMPAFLSHRPGLGSGLMIPQYVAASLVSENKVLAHPSSVDSIPTSANQEDHVSMGTTAARHALQVVENTAKVLAIELICAAEAVGFSVTGKEGLSPATRVLFEALRAQVPSVSEDRSLSRDITETSDRLIGDDSWLEAVEQVAGELF